MKSTKAPMYGVECPLQNKTYIISMRTYGVCPCCGEIIGDDGFERHVIKFINGSFPFTF